MKEFENIPWYGWLYQINKKWDIYNWRKILKQWDKSWYKYVKLTGLDWKWKLHRIHRLVLLTFKWDSELQVNHINWIRCDNRLENLEYCTAEENNNRKVFWIKAKRIWLLNNDNEIIKEYDSASDVCKDHYWLDKSNLYSHLIWKWKSVKGNRFIYLQNRW